jgi:hypothetical protein
MYKAITHFTDLQDNNHKYQAGDIFPRDGYNPSKSRVAELLSNKNKQGKPVITEVVEEAPVDKPKKGRQKNDAK